jgi:hypothetical protein
MAMTVLMADRLNIAEHTIRMDNIRRSISLRLNSTWFMATKDAPGLCPGADWRSGPVGVRGKPGDRGPAGPIGPMGRAAPDPREIVEYVINEGDYTITPVMSDGTLGPIIQARALFERYDAERD